MRQSFLTAICLTSMVGCVPPNAVGQEPTATPQHQTVAVRQSLRVVGNTLYFLNAPPDKTKPQDFKDAKAINSHYAKLLAAIKKRNPVQDARFAFNNGMRYFLTVNGINVAQPQRGNTLGVGTPEVERRCPGSARIKRFEGVKFYENFVECQGTSSACSSYISFVGGGYMLPWNKEMTRLCHGGT